MKDRIDNLIDELNKELQTYNSYPMYNHNGALIIEVEWGDWKHDHWMIDDLVQEKADDLGMVLLAATSVVTEEDGSDCYSATHKYIFAR